MIKGIYTLANDAIYDQLVALINSIEANISEDIPICIIPYDNDLEKVKKLVSGCHITLFDDQKSIQRWEDFTAEVWAAHPAAEAQSKIKSPWYYKSHILRKFCSFDGHFDKFVFYDADSLAMKPIDDIFEKLDTYDLVFDDLDHTKPSALKTLNIQLMVQSGLFKEMDIVTKFHCTSFFGAKKGYFGIEELLTIKKRLIV